MEKKLKQLIRDDRPKKLKSYIESRDIEVTEVMLGKGRTCLHYAALHGSPSMIKCLLKLDCPADIQDRQGNLPLHVAAYRALEEDLCVGEVEEVLQGHIVPLLTSHPLGQDIENSSGVTGHDLVSKVKDRLKAGKLGPREREEQRSRVQEEEEEMWRRKMAEETQAEYEELNPRYDYMEDVTHEENTESYEEWSDRLYREMSQKRHQQSHEFTRDKKKSRENRNKRKSPEPKQSKEDEQRERLRKAREEMRKNYKPPPYVPSSEKLLEKKKRYESKFSHLLKQLPGRTLTFGCIPWPHVNLDSVAATLFCDLPDKTSPAYRKYLRVQQVRWHPDKFTQKFGEYLHADHAAKVMSRVKGISQLLNKLAGE